MNLKLKFSKLAALCGLAIMAGVPVWGGVVIEQNQKVEGPGMNMDMHMTTSVEGGRMRIDIKDMSAMIYDSADGKITTLMPAQKMAMVMTKETMAKMQGGEPAAADEGEPEVKPTGKSETIAGLKAEEYTFKGAGMTGTMWVAKEFPMHKELTAMQKGMSAGNKMDPSARLAGAIEKATGGGYPVRMDANLDQNGQKMRVVMEVTKVEEKAVPGDAFAVPDGYTVQDMAAILGGGGVDGGGE